MTPRVTYYACRTAGFTCYAAGVVLLLAPMAAGHTIPWLHIPIAYGACAAGFGLCRGVRAHG